MIDIRFPQTLYPINNLVEIRIFLIAISPAKISFYYYICKKGIFAMSPWPPHTHSTRQKEKVKLMQWVWDKQRKSLSQGKSWFSNPYIFSTCWCILLIFQTWIKTHKTHRFRYLRSSTDIGFRKSKFVAIPLFDYKL